MNTFAHVLDLDGVVELRPQKFGDARGFFSETWNADLLSHHGLKLDFVQDNHSYSVPKGVLRGLHYQLPPFAQDKLVRVVRGAIFDVAIDIRHGSPDFGRWTALEISSRAWNQILVPKGFAHGFLTLEPHTEVIYKVTAPYSPAHDRSIRFDDPELAIGWPLPDEGPILSEKDRSAPFLDEAELFTYREGALA